VLTVFTIFSGSSSNNNISVAGIPFCSNQKPYRHFPCHRKENRFCFCLFLIVPSGINVFGEPKEGENTPALPNISGYFKTA
jgi:hypothetical protein